VIENARLSEEERELERVKNELALAAEIQTRLLPKTQPDIEGYDIAGITVPAQEVGGDYFDFVPALNGGLAICLGDVSGKGLPAALLMAHLQAAVRSHVLTDARPARCLERCNALLAAGTDVDKFATCFHCVLDPREHVIAYANAGHERPIVISDRGEVRRLESGGTVLGFLDEVAYEEGRAELARGDVVVIFSDGVTDALNDQGEPFGEGRLIGLLRRGARDNARDVIDGTLDAVRMHSAGTPQTDDMTIVVIKRHGG
jgi:sigma-B regulation protein RsbU (phosphoserine phosphatase)